MSTKKRISVGLSPGELAELEELAVQHGVSLAWLGRQAVVRLLEQYKRQEYQLPLELPASRGG